MVVPVGPPKDVTRLLETVCGDEAPNDRLFERSYADLRRMAGFLMARQPPGQTLQATALVNEAYLKLVNAERVQWQGRAHFLRVSADCFAA